MLIQQSQGRYRKHKAYGLVGCLTAVLATGLTYDVQAAVVNGGNDIREVDVHHPDNSGVAMTYTRFDNGRSRQTASGSGVFIAPNIMVTVAHNYLDKNKDTNEGFVRGGDSAQSYVVTNSNTEKRAGNPSSGEDQLVNKGDIHYYNKSELGKSYTNDLAVVVTEKPIEAMTHGEDSSRLIGTAKQGDKIHMVGYPNDFSSQNLSADVRHKLKDGKLYAVSGTISELNTTTGEGKYHMSALGGFSGGPIFNDSGQVIGIHQHGTNSDAIPDAQQYGAGLFFTDKHKAWIKEMVDKYAIKGWYVDGDAKYYYDENHQPVRNSEREIDGGRYRFDERGRGTFISGKETGRILLKAVNKQGDILFERVVGQGSVGDGFTYDFKSDKNNQAYFAENPNATVVSVDGEIINKKFSEAWDKDFASKYQLGNTVIKAVIDGGQKFTRTVSGSVDTGSSGVKPLMADDKVKAVPNGERNFNATVALTSEAGLGSGTLIDDDMIVTVAHNFVHLNTKTNPISVANNVNKSGDIHLATLPNGKQVRFSNDDIHFWNREGFVNGFKNDLVVIKLRNKFTGERGAKLHDTVQNLKSGDTVHVFGFPKGKLNPILNGNVEHVENYGANIMGVAYQGSAPGMSGGGLYNAQGELIGVHQNGVEGMRSGGIAFSKEQLDWIKSVVNDENTPPVYLKDEPREDDKDKKPEKPADKISTVVLEPSVEYVGDVSQARGYEHRVDGGKGYKITTTTYEWDNTTNTYKEKVLDPVIKPAGKTIITVGVKPEVVKSKDDQGRDVVNTTTYNVDKTTGEIKSSVVTTYGTFKEPTVTTTELPAPKRYVKDPTRNKGEKDIIEDGVPGKSVTTITYTVNEQTGEITPVVGPPVVTKPVPTIVKVAAKDRTITEVIEPSVRYESDDSRDYGSDDIRDEGPKGSKSVSITYEVDELTGFIDTKMGTPVVTPAGVTVIKVATKPKSEIVRRDGKVYNHIINYAVDATTGKVTPGERYELLLDSITTPTVDIPKYDKPVGSLDGDTVTPPKVDKPIGGSLDDNGNVIAPPTVEIPEYNKPIGGSLDDNGNVITPPTVEIPEYNKPIGGSLDDNGNVITPPTVEIPKVDKSVGGSLDNNGNVITPPTVEIPKVDKPVGGSLGDDGNVIVPPTVEIPKVDKPVGGSLGNDGNVIVPPTVEIPKVAIHKVGKPIGGSFNSEVNAPEQYDIPEFAGGVNPDNAPVNDVPEFKGGVAPDNAPVNDVPEFTGVVVPNNAPVNEAPEFAGGVVPNNAPVNKAPEFTGGVDSDNVQVNTVPEVAGEVVRDKRSSYAGHPTSVQAKSLPNTGDAESLLALGSTLSMIGLAMRRKYKE